MTVKMKPCGFSIDLVSKEYLDIVSIIDKGSKGVTIEAVSYTHLRAHET